MSLTWAKHPGFSGWYWWRVSIAHHAKIVYVSASENVNDVFSFAHHPAKTYGGEWYGPLHEPGGDAVEDRS